MIIEELYEALREAGASEEKARAAARVVANYDNRFVTIERDLTVLKWMAGFNTPMLVAVLFKGFS